MDTSDGNADVGTYLECVGISGWVPNKSYCYTFKLQHGQHYACEFEYMYVIKACVCLNGFVCLKIKKIVFSNLYENRLKMYDIRFSATYQLLLIKEKPTAIVLLLRSVDSPHVYTDHCRRDFNPHAESRRRIQIWMYICTRYTYLLYGNNRFGRVLP